MGGEGDTSLEFCYEGHIGALCEECDITAGLWSESYANSGPFVCDKCSNVSGNLIKIVLVNIFILVNMFLSVKGTIEGARLLIYL